MNRVEQILKQINGILPTTSAMVSKAQEQTALEFSKWKDENYIYVGGIIPMYQPLNKIGEATIFNRMLNELRTTDQLFNEWNNLKTK